MLNNNSVTVLFSYPYIPDNIIIHNWCNYRGLYTCNSNLPDEYYKNKKIEKSLVYVVQK